MFRIKTHSLAAAAAIIAVTTGTVSMPHAARAASTTTFGSVDVQKIIAGYGKKPMLDQQIQDMNMRLDGIFKQQVASGMLNKDQQNTLGQLLQKTTKTDADQQQIVALQAQSTRDQQELLGLQTKKDSSQADKDRLDQLTRQQQAGQQILQDVATAYRDQVQQQNEKLSAKLSEDVKAAISTIAKQKGLDVVFDSQVAIYASTDITADVLARLNK